jgi:hypothetical protein
VLRDGSDCIVMHVSHAPVEILVSAYLSQPGDTAPVLKIDRVALDAAPVAPSAVQTGGPVVAAIEISGSGVSLIGHIERTGNVVAGDGQTLGNPSTNLRLEGFQVMWPDMPNGIGLSYSVTMEGVGPIPSVSLGNFCGSRNEARRVTEVTFSLTGPQASQYQLDGKAYFSGGFEVTMASGVAISGPSGLEHLCALSLRIVARQQVTPQVENQWHESPRTKVFKSAAPTKKTAAKKPLSPPVKKPQKV